LAAQLLSALKGRVKLAAAFIPVAQAIEQAFKSVTPDPTPAPGSLC